MCRRVALPAADRERKKLHKIGWANYFSLGYATGAHWEIDWYVRGRLIQHLQRRSQRPYRRPQGEQWLQHLAKLGLIRLSGTAHA